MGLVTDADITKAIRNGCMLFRGKIRNVELIDMLTDSVTDSVLWSIARYDQSKGSFETFARRSAKTFTHRKLRHWIGRRAQRHRFFSLSRFGASEPRNRLEEDILRAVSITSRDSQLSCLPDGIRIAATLYMIHGYTFRECGPLLGCSAEKARAMVFKAAKLLGGVATKETYKSTERIASKASCRMMRW